MPNIFWMPSRPHRDARHRYSLGPGHQVFGADLATIAKPASPSNALQQDERTASFTRSAFAERSTGGYFLGLRWTGRPPRALG